MTFKRYDWKGLRGSKRKTLKIGKRSIYDIIKDEELDFGDKLDYIRHHYVYYEGNYEYFHDERGKSNENKECLNRLIGLIIQRLADPSELRVINQEILAWRKAKKLIEKQQEAERMAKFNETHIRSPYEMKVNVWFEKWINKYDYDKVKLMRDYLLAHDQTYKNTALESLIYKELKIKATSWKNHQNQLKKAEEKMKQNANENGEEIATAI